MPQAKKKKSTKTAKKTTAKKTTRVCHKKAATITRRERAHVCLVTALSIVTVILLCADMAMMSIR